MDEKRISKAVGWWDAKRSKKNERVDKNMAVGDRRWSKNIASEWEGDNGRRYEEN